MRTIDKTKKSNIKCEHCEYWNRWSGICWLNKAEKNYWNRCTEFNWHHRYDGVKGELEAWNMMDVKDVSTKIAVRRVKSVKDASRMRLISIPE